MSRGATARLFVAADPPSAVRAELAAWAARANAGAAGPSPLRLLGADSLHLTLCFLGSRPVAEIAPLTAEVAASAAHIGELSLGAPLWLPPARPRALAVAVNDEQGALAELQSAVVEAISAASDWRAERRRFRAHVTVARTRGASRRGRSGSAGPDALPATPQLHFIPESITLYRSWLSPEGASHEPLARSSLRPPEL